ncbi:MAG TPA: SpoIIE family protein phosphatase [Gemmatimonadaceae bacterium]|nr:SpoIIE family protein phosphatase [Gemmatimonadaceae bacterium]
MTAASGWSGGYGMGDLGAPRGGPSARVFAVDDASQVGEVRRAAASLAAETGLSETERGTVAVIVTEMATNLARHARGGRILLAIVGEPRAAVAGVAVAATGVELIALDDGPGIVNVGRAMGDGFSTAGSAGQGLGAMRRMASEFDVYSRTGAAGASGIGTVVLARVWPAGTSSNGAAGAAAAAARAGDELASAAVCVALAGESVCGDGWVVLRRVDRTLVVVVDGLGHGPDAAVAASEAVRIVRAHPDASPADLLQAAHGALRATRGAAMSIAAIYPSRGTLTFAGVGNVSAAVYSAGGTGAMRNLAPHNGTVGHTMRTVREISHEWTADSGLVMHSDGVNTRWRLDGYPGLAGHHPALLAGVLYRDAARGRDDATVVAVRDRRTLA